MQEEGQKRNPLNNSIINFEHVFIFRLRIGRSHNALRATARCCGAVDITTITAHISEPT